MNIVILGLKDPDSPRNIKVEEFALEFHAAKSSAIQYEILESTQLTPDASEIKAINEANHLILYITTNAFNTPEKSRLFAQGIRAYISSNQQLDNITLLAAITDYPESADYVQPLRDLVDIKDRYKVTIGFYIPNTNMIIDSTLSSKTITESLLFTTIPNKPKSEKKEKQTSTQPPPFDFYNQFRIQSESPSYTTMQKSLGSPSASNHSRTNASTVQSNSIMSVIEKHPWVVGGMTLISGLGGGLGIGSFVYLSALSLSVLGGPIGTAIVLGLSFLALSALAVFLISVGIAYYYEQGKGTNDFDSESFLDSYEDSESDFENNQEIASPPRPTIDNHKQEKNQPAQGTGSGPRL